MIFVGAVHTVITPMIFPSSVQSIVEGGVIASIEADPEQAGLRGLAFWYVSTGLALVAYGVSVAERERHEEPLPSTLPVCLAGLGVWGVLLMPKSPFWVFLALAGLAVQRRRSARAPMSRS